MSSSSSSPCPVALFNNTCITDSPCKVDFKFIADCAIPNLPDPIYDCTPPTPPPFEPPPEFCPDIISGPTRVNVKYLSNCSSSSHSSSSANNGSLIITKSVDCAFVIGLDLDIPIKAPPCPVFNTTQPPRVNVVFDKTNCGSSSSYTNTITITPIPGDCSNGEDTACSFDINLDLTVPIPKIPCPTINAAQTVKVTPYYDRKNCTQKTSTFTVATTPIPGDCNTPDTCQFDFNLDLLVPQVDPPCPQFNKGNVAVTTHYQHEPPPKQSTFEVVQVPSTPNCNDPQQCEFNLNLDLVVPLPTIPCPQFNYVGTTISPGPEFRVNSIQIVPQQDPPNSGDPCQFDIALDITVPPVGGISILPTELTRSPSCEIDPEFKLVLSDKNTKGEQTLQLKVLLPANQIIRGGVITLGSYGSGVITVNKADPCNPEITANITLNTAACTTSGGGGGSSSTGGGGTSCCTYDCAHGTGCTESCPPGTYCGDGTGAPAAIIEV